MFSFLLGSCDNNQRTPSKLRLESTGNIKLPSTFTVLKDEFQDMGQDYVLYYDLQFDISSMRSLTISIKKSRLYHADGSSAMYSDSIMNRKPNDFSVWYPISTGYEFNGKDGAVLYTIKVDTTLNTLKYQEYVL